MTATALCVLLVLAAAASTTTSAASSAKYLHVWAGPRTHHDNDFLATFSLDRNNSDYGALVCKTLVNTSGNEPHHLSVLANGHTLVATGLLSVLKSQDEVFFFEIPDESPCPKFTASFDVPNAAVADDVLALPGGGFLVPMMGAVDGGTPGSVAVFANSSQASFVGTFPEVALVNSTMNPHGIDVNTQFDLLITTDYIEPSSTLLTGPTNGTVLGRTSVTVWSLSNMSVMHIVNITELTGRTANGGKSGIMDVKFIPNDPLARAFVNGGGVLYLLDPLSAFVAVAHVYGAEDGPCIQAMRSDGQRMYSSQNGAGRITAFDISDPTNLIVLSELYLPDGAGPHVAKLAGTYEDMLVVADYFLQEEPMVGVVWSPADYHVRIIDVVHDELVLRTDWDIDFSHHPGLPPSNPHGLAVV